MGDNSLFRGLIDDIEFAILPVKNFLRDTFSCDLNVTNAVRARIVRKNKGLYLIPRFPSLLCMNRYEPVTLKGLKYAGKIQQKDNLKRCPDY